jgi:hypothetical protein
VLFAEPAEDTATPALTAAMEAVVLLVALTDVPIVYCTPAYHVMMVAALTLAAHMNVITVATITASLALCQDAPRIA